MIKRLLTAILVICVMALSPITLLFSQPSSIAPKSEQQLLVTRAAGPADKADFYEQNAVDTFSITYKPMDSRRESVALCEVYTFTQRQWTAVMADAAYTEDYAPVKITEHFVFVVHKSPSNPYEAGIEDRAQFEALTADIPKLLDSFHLGEVALSETRLNSIIKGLYLYYEIFMPPVDRLMAVRRVPAADEIQKEGVIFVLAGLRKDAVVATFNIYDSDHWRAVNTLKEDNLVLDFMGYALTVNDSPANPLPADSDDAKALGKAYATIQKAAAGAMLYNHEGTGNAMRFPKGQKTARLSIGGGIVADPVLIYHSDKPLFPLRALAQALGCKVDWDAASGTFIIIKDGSLLAAKSIESSYTLENYELADQISCSIINGKTYVNMDFVVNVLGCQLAYDGSGVITAIFRTGQ